MEEQNKTGYIFIAITVLIMAGMLSFGFKMFKESRSRMDKMEEKFEKEKKESKEKFNKDVENMKTIIVPDVAGMDVKEATKKLEEAGFVVSDQQEKVSDTEIAEGKVVKTIPAAGSERNKGTEVYLFISENTK